MTLVVRTGPVERNVRMMTRFKQLNMTGHAYAGVTKDGQEIPCPDEETVFRLVGWPWVTPERRS